MDLLHLSSLIIVSVLALCVIDVIRRPRLGELVQARYDAEHPHPLARNCARRPQRVAAPESIRERGIRATHRNAHAYVGAPQRTSGERSTLAARCAATPVCVGTRAARAPLQGVAAGSRS